MFLAGAPLAEASVTFQNLNVGNEEDSGWEARQLAPNLADLLHEPGGGELDALARSPKELYAARPPEYAGYSMFELYQTAYPRPRDGGGWVARTVPAVLLVSPYARPRPTSDLAEWERYCYLHFTLHERYGTGCEHATAAAFRAPPRNLGRRLPAPLPGAPR